METTTLYKIIIVITLLAFWWYSSEALTVNPSLTLAFIAVPLGLLAVIAIVIQLVLKESIEARMKEVLDSEIEERKEELVEELRGLVSYLEKTKVPNYGDSGVEGLEDAFQEFDSVKSKYTFRPKIIHSTIFMVLSTLILTLFWANPTLWVAKAEGRPDITLSHVGLGFLIIGLWMILSILVTSLEVKAWEKEF